MISVIIPAYNAEKYIEETIRSVLNQTYTDLELIIVIDGATDRTAEIAKSFCTDKRVKVIEKPNTGVSDTRNVGMAQSNGEYLAFLDADDVWLPENLQKKVNILTKNHNIGWVYSNMYELDDNTKNIKEAPRGIGTNILHNILSWKGEVVPGPCSNIVIRKELYEKGVRFDKKLSTAADQDFTLQLAKISDCYFIDDFLWKYRIISTSMSRNISVMEKDHIGVYKKAAKNGLFESEKFRRQCFANLYLILAGSWWKDGNNKKRGLHFILKSFFTSPKPVIKKVLCRKK